MTKTILKSWGVVFLLLTAITDASFAQSREAGSSSAYVNQQILTKDDQTEESEFKLNRDYWKGYITDTANILASPSRWENQDWIKASLLAGAAVGLYAYDQEMQNWAQKNRSSASDKIADFARLFGDVKYNLSLPGAFYLYGHFYEDEKARKTAMMGLESVVISGIFTGAIKFAGHRHRPDTGDPYNTWGGPGFSTSNLSFPSEHSSSAFAIATVIATQYEDKAFVPPLAYGIAALTALSRVNDNDHWTSDVFLGSAIGYFTAKAIIGLHGKGKNRKLTGLPIMDGKRTILLISYKF